MGEVRHVVALSGGKDSAALAVYLREKNPHLGIEYVFTDSGCELPETYEYLDRIRAVLNIDINVIRSQKNFDYWLKYYNGVLPSPQARWCTRHLKLEPYEDFLGDTLTYSYIAIRADEEREGYRNTKGNIIPIYPFIEDNITLPDVIRILEDSGLGLPKYYEWRKRSGCFFCFYQSDREWLGLKKHHPDLFEKACQYEENHADGRTYTWRDPVGNEHRRLRDLHCSNIPEPPPENKEIVDSRLLKRLRRYLY
ncbi:MAG: phosphoadenosine phosphosulfate reductase family protein [Bacillota bacterium]|jgi:3'-phosphoadenosine 5'-phosphosulfate sulfotransferase (PAPS reductase)/FAD synthetase